MLSVKLIVYRAIKLVEAKRKAKCLWSDKPRGS